MAGRVRYVKVLKAEKTQAQGALADGPSSQGNAYVFLVIAPLLWGGNAVAGKMSTSDWGPFVLTSLRWGFAVVILFVFGWRIVRQDWAVIRQNLPFLFLLGALGMAVFNMLMYLALQTTTAINVSIIQSVAPCIIMLTNFVLFRQRTVALQVVGLLISILGVVLVTTSGRPLSLLEGDLVIGDVWMLLASAFYAGYTIALRWRPPIHWLSFLTVIGLSAFITTIPFTAWEQMHSPQVTTSFSAWLVLAYIVVFPTMISQLAWLRGVELIGSNRAGVFLNLVPIFGSALAVLLLGESFAWYHALGLVFVIGGISLAERVART